MENEFYFGFQQTGSGSYFLHHPSLNFNDAVVIQSKTQKHLGIILDTKLDFQEHLKYKVLVRSARGLDY